MWRTRQSLPCELATSGALPGRGYHLIPPNESPYRSSMRHVTVAEDGRRPTEHSLLSRDTEYHPVAAAKRYRTVRESVNEPDVSALETTNGGGPGALAEDNPRQRVAEGVLYGGLGAGSILVIWLRHVDGHVDTVAASWYQ